MQFFLISILKLSKNMFSKSQCTIRHVLEAKAILVDERLAGSNAPAEL